MNFLAERILSDVISDIQSKVNVPVDFSVKKKASAPGPASAQNAGGAENGDKFNEILLNYLNGTSDSKEINKAIELAITTSSKKFNVDENLVRAVIKQESAYDPYAVSSAGAMGLMQLMPGTAESLGVKDPYNVFQNIHGGVKYLYEMLLKFDGDESLALAAYNAGPGSVLKYGGIPPYTETQNYVPAVLNYKNQYMLDAYAKQK